MKPIDPYNRWHWIGLLAVLWYSIFGGLFFTLGAPFGRAPVYPTDHNRFFTFWSLVYLNEWLFAALVLVCVRKSRAGFESIGLLRPQLRATIWLAIVLVGLAMAFTAAPQGVRLSLATEAQRQSFAWTHGERVFLLVVACLTAPFCEEVMYRGFLLAFLRSVIGLRLAILLQGLLFGYQHAVLGGWRGGPGAAIFGLLIAPLAIMRGDLRAAMAVHFLVDAAMLAGAVFGP